MLSKMILLCISLGAVVSRAHNAKFTIEDSGGSVSIPITRVPSPVKVEFRNDVLTEAVTDTFILNSFDQAPKTGRIAKLFVVSNRHASTWAYAVALQKEAIRRLSNKYEAVKNISVEIHSASQVDGLLSDAPAPASVTTEVSYDKSFLQARTSLYLEEPDVDYYFLFAGGNFGEMNPKILNDIDYIDKHGKASVFFGRLDAQEKKNILTTLNVHKSTFANLSVFKLEDLLCAGPLYQRDSGSTP